MNEALFALVLVFNPTMQYSTEEVYSNSLSFAACDAAQHAIWEQEAETIGYDAEGFAVPAFDAYCIEANKAPVERLTTSFYY